MTKTDSAYIGQNRQRNNDGSSVVWPAADNSGALPPLGYNADDLFIGNYGLDTVYVSTDGLTTLTFGASLVGGSFSGTASDNTVAIPYSGPYLTVAPGSFDKTDPAFRGLIELGYAEPFRDNNTGRIPIHWHSGGSLVHGAHHAPGAVNYLQMNPAQHGRGHFVGGRIAWGLSGSHPFLAVQANLSAVNDTVFFVTDDGTGDGVNAGRFLIWGAGGYGGQAVIGNTTILGGVNLGTDTPANYLITFTRLFPAAATVTNTTGSLIAGTTYYVRFCFTKSFGGQTIESALSPLLTLTGQTGYQLNIGTPPAGYSGVRVYYATNPNTLYTQSGGSYSAGVFSLTSTAGDVGSFPSYGFASWAPGVNITAAGGEDLMKIAHVSGQKSVASGLYVLHGYHSGLTPTEAVHHAEQSITGGQPMGGVNMPNHLTPSSVHYSHLQSFTTTASVTPFAAHKVAAADGSGAVVYEDVVPAAGSITLGMLGTGAVDGPAIASASVTSVKLGFLANSAFSLDVTSGDTGAGSVNVSSWVSNTWYHFSVTHSSVGIKTFQQVLCAMTTDHSGESGYGDDGPVTWFRNSGGVYSDSTAHVPTGTGPQPILIASASDYGEVMLTSAWTDGSQLTVTGWGRVTASGSTKLTLRITLQGALQ